MLINKIGPVRDGNQVWMITAADATFAAFPDWYATLFSGFYLLMFVILVCLILRGVAFEYRVKRDGERWKRNWESVIFGTSLLLAFLWDMLFATMVYGVPIGPEKDMTGGLTELFQPYALLGGVTTTALSTLHGAVFAALKTVGDIRVRARALAGRLGVIATALLVTILTWTQIHTGTYNSLIAEVLALLYQGWTYWVFRRRIGVQHIPATAAHATPETAAVDAS